MTSRAPGSGWPEHLADDGHEVFAYACPGDVPEDGGRFAAATVLITDYERRERTAWRLPIDSTVHGRRRRFSS